MIPECQSPSKARNMCNKHYLQWMGENPIAARLVPRGFTRDELFLLKVYKTDGCWLWTGKIDKRGKGYGVFTYRENGKPKSVGAHRYAYELWVGPIPPGLTIDHIWPICQNTHCVRAPGHLEPVTPAEQNRRYYSRQTHCKWGHKFTPENTRISPEGHRLCRQCTRRRVNASYRKQNPVVGGLPKELKPACKHGHKFTPENTKLRADGARLCIQCSRDNTRKWQAKQR